MSRQPRLIMFDYDGVIADSLDVFCSSVTAALTEHGFPKFATREAVLELLNDNWFTALAAAGVPPEVSQKVEDAFTAAVSREDGGPAPFGGMPAVLQHLAERHHVVVITSSRSDVVERFLARHGVTAVQAVMGNDVDTSKVRKIHTALARCDGANPDAWYVGDTVGDIREGKAAGVKTVATTWGWQREDMLRGAEPDRVATAPAELLEIF